MKMAPKKSVDGKTPASTKKTQEKKLKAKQLKTPTVIKVKIPIAGAKSNMTNLSPKIAKTPKISKKQQILEKKAQEKFDLANEVALAQLVKSKPVISTPIGQDDEPKVPKKRGKKKKVEEAITSANSEDDFEPSPAKKKCVRKVPKSAKPLNKKVEAVKNVKKALSLSLSQQKTPKAVKSETIKTQKSIDKIPLRRGRKRKLQIETGKNADDTVSANGDQSPSLLAPIEGKIPIETSSDPNKEACPIDSRKTSFTSELSWTRDISSSSTTTCFTVCSTDFVRIDKRIPILKLDDIGIKKIETNNNFPSSASESSESQSIANKEDEESTPDVETRSLDLSTSSVTATRSIVSCRENSVENNVINDQINKTNEALDKLTAKLKKFDLEIINWIGYDNEDVSVGFKRFQGKIFQVLKEESDVITQCQRLKRVLSNNVDIDNDLDADNDVDFAADDVVQSNNFNSQLDDNNMVSSPNKARSGDDENNFTSDKVKYKSFDQSCDDDDALSLFAESITGIDTSTHNSCAASMCNAGDFEEYVPKMITSDRWEPAKKISYTPTTIINAEKPNQDVSKARTVCQKQNADSTSIYKDNEQGKDENVSFDRRNPHNTVIEAPNRIRVPKLMSFYYKPSYGQRSNVLKGICFFNLLSSCKKINCLYPHVVPDYKDITAKLVRLSEESFIQEYMLLRDWPELRRKYGMCFVEECRRRDLTRILVEMAKDFVMKAKVNVREDAVLKVEVIECALLHLNAVDLSLCEDLLMYNLQKDMPLCDVFMQAIANTQNFSRFKPVFMKLTKFMLHYQRTFSLEVASQILERLSILPCERPLLEALLEIVKHTDRRILENSMMGHFEKQLLVHKDLHEQLLVLKRSSLNRPAELQSSVFESPLAKDVEPLMGGALVSEREKRYTSPDTTNLDNMNKPPEEPAATPTIEFSRAGLFSIQRTFSTSPGEEFRPKVKNKPNYKSWRDMSIFDNIRSAQAPRPLMDRLVHQPMNYGRSPPKFPRRSVPDYY